MPGTYMELNLAGSTLLSVTVTAANSCQVILDTPIVDPPLLQIASIISNDPGCFGGSDGDALATAAGGTGSYTFGWSGGQSGTNALGLDASTHSVTVTDANGCTASDNVTLNDPPQLTASAVGTDVTCNGGADGTATVTGVGGTVAIDYSYLWTDFQTTAAIGGKTAGCYTVTVTDDNGCSATADYCPSQPTVVTVTTTQVDPFCGQSTGTITATGAGGTPGYTYNWSDGQTTQTATGLPAGTYTVTATDGNGCTGTISATLIDQPGVTATASVNANASCEGTCNDGEVTVSGDINPTYTYIWDDINSSTTATVSALDTGTYCVTVTDIQGCTSIDCATITAEPLIVYIGVVTHVTCFSGTDGAIDITYVSGGNLPIASYLWSDLPPTTTEDISNIPMGTYTVTITDALGITVTYDFTVNQPTEVTASVTALGISCFGANDGSATVTFGGGTVAVGHDIDWSDGTGNDALDVPGPTHQATGLAQGAITVTVTDDVGCTATATDIVNEPALLSINITGSTNPVCGTNSGTINSVAVGGTGAS